MTEAVVWSKHFHKQMADKKQLVLVVEGTAALGSYWHNIVLQKVIRSFCGIEAMKAASPIVELALVIFNSHGSYSPCLVQRSGWTRNVELFLSWLSGMHFSHSGLCDAAIAEGLSEALMMFPLLNGSQNGYFQGHCILVAASNPYPLPTLVYQPPQQKLEMNYNNNINNCQLQSESIRLSDAETLAKSFPQCFVSLSVISPIQLPKLKAIYNAGKRKPSAADPTSINIVKNPDYLLLISEAFMEARIALSQPHITDIPSNSVNILPANVKVEPSVVPSMASSQASNVLQSKQSKKYVKVWEGNFFGMRHGQPVYITRLECYQSTSASESLAENWPPQMEISRLISQDYMHNNNYIEETFVVFRAMNQHGFLQQVYEKKLCAVIELPSHTLLLAVLEKECRLIGRLFPQGMFVSKPKVSWQQPPPPQELFKSNT